MLGYVPSPICGTMSVPASRYQATSLEVNIPCRRRPFSLRADRNSEAAHILASVLTVASFSGSFVLAAWRRNSRSRSWSFPSCSPRLREQAKKPELQRRAARVYVTDTVSYGPETAQDIPPSGSDAVRELSFLLGDPFTRRLNIITEATADFPSVAAEKAWDLLVGAEGGSVSAPWMQLQPTSCYGIPALLQLVSVAGKISVGSEIVGELGIRQYSLRRFFWKVEKAEFANGIGTLQLEGRPDGEPEGVRHTIRITALPTAGCQICSEVRYSPSPPLQTFLNAAGGRASVVEGNEAFLRRVGVVAAGDIDFNAVGFYNLLGPGIDLMAPFEDAARALLAERADLLNPQARLEVLEVGCGTGRWAEELLTTTSGIARYVALESSETMALIAARRLSSLSDETNARVVRGDARQLGLMGEVSEKFLGAAPSRLLFAYVLDLLDDSDVEAVLADSRELLAKNSGKLAVCSICPGSPVMDAWESAWKLNPGLVGGCRPVDVSARLKNAGWQVLVDERVDAFGYLSQVIVAQPV